MIMVRSPQQSQIYRNDVHDTEFILKMGEVPGKKMVANFTILGVILLLPIQLGDLQTIALKTTAV